MTESEYTDDESREIVFNLKQECAFKGVDYHPYMFRLVKQAMRHIPIEETAMGQLHCLLEAISLAVDAWISRQLRLNLPGLRERLLSDPEFVVACKMILDRTESKYLAIRTPSEYQMAWDMIKKALKRHGIPVSAWLDPDTHKPCGISTIIHWVTDDTSDTDGGMANG